MDFNIPKNANQSLKFETVVLGGGGIKGFFTLGALHYHHEKGSYDMNLATTYCGTSVGSAISLLLVCGYTPMDIFTDIHNQSKIFDLPVKVSIWDITEHMGLIPIESLTKKIGPLVEKKFGYIPTLLELYNATGKKLIATVANVSKMICQYYSYETEPNMLCTRAIELSCSVPIIFYRNQHEDEYIVDGGLVNNFPLEYVDDGKKKILAIATVGSENAKNDDDLISYFHKLLSMPMRANNEFRMSMCKENTTLVTIKESSHAKEEKKGIFTFEVDSNKRMEMFLHGYQTAGHK